MKKLSSVVSVFLYIFLTQILLTGCSENSSKETSTRVELIEGRDKSAGKIYRCKVPKNWIRVKPESESFENDTRLPICEFILPLQSEISIVIHNFPVEKEGGSIPPIAQINRWQSQFDSINQLDTLVVPIAWGGFSGYHLDASGILKGSSMRILGWAMQIAPEHTRILLGTRKGKQMRADWTIKATGPEELIAINQQEIKKFAESFELLEPI